MSAAFGPRAVLHTQTARFGQTTTTPFAPGLLWGTIVPMRTLLCLCLLSPIAGCATATAPGLISVTAWEAVDASAPQGLTSLVLPRNGDLTVGAITVEGPEAVVGQRVVVLRLRTEDGGTMTWQGAPEALTTERIRAKGLTGLEVAVGVLAEGPQGVSSGPGALATIPQIGPQDPERWRRIAQVTAEVGGDVWLAARMNLEAYENGSPGVTQRHLTFRGASAEDARAVVVTLAIEVEVVDRSYRPKEKHKRRPKPEFDPVREPPPRRLADLR